MVKGDTALFVPIYYVCFEMRAGLPANEDLATALYCADFTNLQMTAIRLLPDISDFAPVRWNPESS